MIKTIKAKYYEESGQIIPLDPQPIRVKGEWSYQRKGTDELGSFAVIDFMSEDAVYFDYDAKNANQLDLTVITEDEWNIKAENSTEITAQPGSDNASNATVPTFEKPTIINTVKNRLISLMGIGRLIKIIKRAYSNVFNAVT